MYEGQEGMVELTWLGNFYLQRQCWSVERNEGLGSDIYEMPIDKNSWHD